MAQLTIGQSLDVIEQLRQAEWDLPATAAPLMAEVKSLVTKQRFQDAKAKLLEVFKATPEPPEKLWIALAGVLTGTDETDIRPYVDYINSLR